MDFYSWEPKETCFHRCFGTPTDVCVDAPVVQVANAYATTDVFALSGVGAGPQTRYVVNTTNGLVSTYGISPNGLPPTLFCSRHGQVVFTDAGSFPYACQFNTCGASTATGFVFFGNSQTPVVGTQCFTDCYVPASSSCTLYDQFGAAYLTVAAADCNTCYNTCNGADPCYFYAFADGSQAAWDVDACYSGSGTTSCTLYNGVGSQITVTSTDSCGACRIVCTQTTGCKRYGFGVASSPVDISQPCGNCLQLSTSLKLVADTDAATCEDCFAACNSADPCNFYQYVVSSPLQGSTWDVDVCASGTDTPNCELVSSSESPILSIYTATCTNCADACTSTGGVCYSINYNGYQGGPPDSGLTCRPN